MNELHTGWAEKKLRVFDAAKHYLIAYASLNGHEPSRRELREYLLDWAPRAGVPNELVETTYPERVMSRVVEAASGTVTEMARARR
jgi:hypothetical protein